MNFRSLLLWFLAIFSIELRADTSWLDKLLVLRFANEHVVQSRSGEIDLNETMPGDYLHVQGDILFFPGEFLEPKFLSETDWQNLAANPATVRTELKLKPFPFPLKGTDLNYGTFLLRIRNAPAGEWRIEPLRGYHPFNLTDATEQGSTSLLKLGTVDRDPENNRRWPTRPPNSGSFKAKGDIYLYAHASSQLHEGKNTLNFSSFLFGPEDKVARVLDISEFSIRAIVGCFFIMFVFYGFIYSFRPQDRSSLYLSGYALTLFAMSFIFTALIPIGPLEAPAIVSSINILSVTLLELYLLDKIKNYITPQRFRKGLFLTFGLTVFSLVAQVLQLKALIGISFLALTGFSIFLIIATLSLGLRFKLDGVIFFSIGTFANLSIQVPLLGTMIGIRPGEYGFGLVLANFAMAISLALVNAREFAVTYLKSIRQSRELEEKNAQITFFNKNLEKLVDQKTEQVRSLLDHIPQGVLSIETDGKVGADYSAHLTQVLESENIAHKSFKELILDTSTLTADTKDQIWQSILAAIGEDSLNWEVNFFKLPRELPLSYQDHTRYMKVTWNAKIKDDIVQNILVTLLDVTQEKALEEAAEAQRQEMQLIQELISIAPSGLAQFFETSEPLLLEIQRILSGNHTSLGTQDVRILFLNAHTVKGAARTLQLKSLADAIHQAEERYSNFLKGSAPLELEEFRRDHDRVMQRFQRYRTLNSEKLNRGNDLNKISLSRRFVEHQYQLIQKLMQDPTQPVSSFLDSLRTQSQELTDIVFDHLPTLFEDYRSKGARIAKDLGKEMPNFHFRIPDTVISRDMHGVLDNCMIHILRNALDHGIEPPELRLASGKDVHGTIRIDAVLLDERFIKIQISDDGRGLALKKLREKGLQSAQLKPESSHQEIAEMIFASGVSTASQISNISGRGVGMDAVRSYLEKVGGSIDVKLGSAKDSDGAFWDFTLEMIVPLYKAEDAVVVSGF